MLEAEEEKEEIELLLLVEDGRGEYRYQERGVDRRQERREQGGHANNIRAEGTYGGVNANTFAALQTEEVEVTTEVEVPRNGLEVTLDNLDQDRPLEFVSERRPQEMEEGSTEHEEEGNTLMTEEQEVVNETPVKLQGEGYVNDLNNDQTGLEERLEVVPEFEPVIAGENRRRSDI